MLVREELARAAGFFNGEGSTIFVGRSLMLKIRQATDVSWEVPDDLTQFQQAVSLGSVSGPMRSPNSTWKDYYDYNVSGFERVQAIIAMLWPWLSNAKRLQAMSCLERYREYCAMSPNRGKGRWRAS